MICFKEERIISKEKIHNFSMSVEVQIIERSDKFFYPHCFSEEESMMPLAYFTKSFYVNSHGILFYEVFD